MKRKGLGMSIGLMVISLLGWTQFSEGVRTVQVLGLFASGALFGVSLARLILAAKADLKS